MTMGTQLPRPLLGWPLFAVPDEFGELQWPQLEASVRDLMRVVLSTRPGEQLMRPDFGAGLELLLHEPNNLDTRRRIRDRVSQSIARWEKRILLDRVDVLDVPGDRRALRVVVGYRLARTGAPAELGFAVTLGG